MLDEVKILCQDVKEKLKKLNIRVHFDDRNNYTCGFKFNYWELRGVPL